MNGRIHYLNTDLDLTSENDLTIIAAEFEAQSVQALHVTRGEDRLWYATFETNEQRDEPETSIIEMVAAVESLTKAQRVVWANCMRREFNIGYDCGNEPWEFNQGLSSELLGRIAQTGASLRITLYPDKRETDNG